MSVQDDVADTLPTEGSPYAIQEDALVDQTFLQQRKRQRDVHNKQLRYCPSPYDNTGFIRGNLCLHPSLPSRVSHTSSSADHDTCTSSVQACSAIFTLHILSCYLRLQISGLHKNMISHCRTELLITVLRLLDSNQT